MDMFKHLRGSPSSEPHMKLLFFASQSIDTRIVVYHYNTQTKQIVVRFCELPDRTFGVPSSFVLGHATPDVSPPENGSRIVSFPLMASVQWTLEESLYKMVDAHGGRVIGMHTTVKALGTSATSTCWTMNRNPKKEGTYVYEQATYNVRNPLMSSLVGHVGE